MSEIVDDLKVANVEVTSNLGLRLSGDEPEIKTTQTLAPLNVTAGSDLTLTSSSGAVNINADGRIDLNSNDVVVGNAGGSIGFYGLTAVTQHNSNGEVTVAAGGDTNATYRNTTFTGGAGMGNEAYTIGDIVKALKSVGLLAKGA
jgi:hypothetical protein